MARSLYGRWGRKFGKQISAEKKWDQVTKSKEKLNDVLKYFPDQNAQKLDKKVIVIGAGFSGLSAAYFLINRGFSVTVLEARKRVGGRVHSNHKFADGQIIEQGAELIGANHPLWVKLALNFGFGLNVVTTDNKFTGARLHEPLVLNGRPVDEKRANVLYKYMDAINKVLADLSTGIDPHFPWQSPNAEEYDKISLSDWLDNEVETSTKIPTEEKVFARQLLETDYTNNNAVITKKQSLLGVLALIRGGGGNNYWSMSEVYRCSNGNDALATALSNAITQSGNEVLLNTAVNKININPNGVSVKDQNGKIHKSDYVVFAIPPSTWGHVKITPPLGNKYQSQMGKAIKHFSTFKDRYWIKNAVAPSGMADTLGMSWEGSDNQILQAGKEVELTVFTGGPKADKIIALPEHKRETFYEDEMEKMYAGYKANLIDTKLQAWPIEKWTKAGYSCPDVGEVCTKIKLQNQPYKDRLFFAGEHTCMAFYGYMEGALESGLYAAARIAQKENVINDPDLKLY